jgi:hypothetical protein
LIAKPIIQVDDKSPSLGLDDEQLSDNECDSAYLMEGRTGEVGGFFWEFDLNGFFLFVVRLSWLFVLLQIPQVESLELFETSQ